MADGILMEMTIDDVRAFDAEVVLLPVGSTEPHGPALPYGTDYFRADAIARRAVALANQRGARALMYPTLPVGNNVNFKAWPLACRMRVQTLVQVLLDIFEALEEDGIRKIVIWNSHGGNPDTLLATLRAHFDRRRPDEGAFVCLANEPPECQNPPIVEHWSDHAGESETSEIMYSRPDLVRTDRLDSFPFGRLAVPILATGGAHFVRSWHRYVPLTAGGEARGASAETGRKVVAAAADHLAELLVQLSRAPWTDSFPYEPEA